MAYRSLLTSILALIGIGLMVFYAWCDTSCAYLRGDIFGIDLKYVGMAYMLAVIVFCLCKQNDILLLLLAAGVGVEVFLVSFQYREEVFCPFCLAFGLIVLVMYILHYERPAEKTRWGQKILFAAGEAKIPGVDIRLPLLVFMILGYLFVSFSFSGFVTPAYGSEITIFFHLQNA